MFVWHGRHLRTVGNHGRTDLRIVVLVDAIVLHIGQYRRTGSFRVPFRIPALAQDRTKKTTASVTSRRVAKRPALVAGGKGRRGFRAIVPQRYWPRNTDTDDRSKPRRYKHAEDGEEQRPRPPFTRRDTRPTVITSLLFTGYSPRGVQHNVLRRSRGLLSRARSRRFGRFFRVAAQAMAVVDGDRSE